MLDLQRRKFGSSKQNQGFNSSNYKQLFILSDRYLFSFKEEKLTVAFILNKKTVIVLISCFE